MTGRPPQTPRFDHRIGLTLHRVLMRGVRRRPRVLLILGTMRAGTSLVSNVLASNPGIAGFGESHIVYDQPESLLDLGYWIFRYTHRYPSRRQYILDKVLHTDYTPDLPMTLGACDAHVLFLVRDPAKTALSLRAMYEKVQPDTAASVDIWSILETRYRDLARLSGDIPDGTPVAALSYEGLLEAPDATLSRLTEFLGLMKPLTASYDVPRWSGIWGIGDGSEKIRSGRIEQRPRPADESADVPDGVREAYLALLERLAVRADPAVL